MSYEKPKTSRRLSRQQVIGAVATLLINVVLYLMVNALFVIEVGSSGGRVVS